MIPRTTSLSWRSLTDQRERRWGGGLFQTSRVIPWGTRCAKIYSTGTDKEDFEGHGFDVGKGESRFVGKRDGTPTGRRMNVCAEDGARDHLITAINEFPRDANFHIYSKSSSP
jgi:hypothetical protein